MAQRRRADPFKGRNPIQESVDRANQDTSPAPWEIPSNVPSVAQSVRGGVDRDDFGPMEIAATAEYYRGPANSSRVAAHQFIPDEEEDDGNSIYKGLNVPESLQPKQFNPLLIYGKIYVRWLNNGKHWVYGTNESIPLTEYRIFRHSRSKGTYVRLLERFGHGEMMNRPPELQI